MMKPRPTEVRDLVPSHTQEVEPAFEPGYLTSKMLILTLPTLASEL